MTDVQPAQPSPPAEDEKPETTERPGKKSSFWRELPILIVTALVLAFLIQTFIARVYVIPSQSMETTLHGCPGCTNDRVLVDKVIHRFTDIEPGEVVVFRGPESWTSNHVAEPDDGWGWLRDFGSLFGMPAANERDFVKRVIAVAGQKVECCTPDNRVIVDGKPLTEPYVHYQEGFDDKQIAFGPVVVPPGHLWMMGDNRPNSRDSRAAGQGPVPVGNVIGKVRAIVLPPSRWQAIDHPNPQVVALSAPAWQSAIPLGLGLAGAWPALWVTRRTSRLLRSRMI
ncbi:signal peptidase I [Allokutzneria multivorans]|uniref:Signal peptidase I n=1 Tax=Allokutzneria multivorans TaxID=1142134 RepID=A0ABP7QUX5_9PSEU